MAALLVPATADAAGPPDLALVHHQRFITATWTVPAGRTNAFIDIAADAAFTNAVEHHVLASTDTFYTSPVQRGAGMYYVRVAVSDPLCTANCTNEFSNTASITLPQAPTNLVVSQSSGYVKASWDLPPGWDTGALDFSRTPEFGPDGFFTDISEFYYPIDGPVKTFDSSTDPPTPDKLPPGLWYINVSGYDPTCLAITCDPEQFSSHIVTVTVTADSSPPPPPPPPPPADKITSFSALKCASTQKAGNLVVSASMPENGTITVGGSLNVPNAAKLFKLKAVSISAPAGKTVRITVKLPSKVLKAVKKALKKHKTVKANLTLTAKDLTGNTATQKRTVRLRT